MGADHSTIASHAKSLLSIHEKLAASQPNSSHQQYQNTLEKASKVEESIEQSLEKAEERLRASLEPLHSKVLFLLPYLLLFHHFPSFSPSSCLQTSPPFQVE